MYDKSLLFAAPAAHPQTHALVIGVGDYPHLKGGIGRTSEAAEGMGQLTTAPASARAFIKWLVSSGGYNNPERPLGSLRVLLSEPSPRTLQDEAGQDLKAPDGSAFLAPSAELAAVQEAATAWYDALDHDERHLGIFFFSGHGVMAGPDQSLLLSDFGSQRLAPYMHAISFNNMHLGMQQVKARKQCYFIDACRVQSRHSRAAGGSHPLIQLSPEAIAAPPRARVAPVFNSTLVGETAFGPANAPSFFTTALLHALRGAGADNIKSDAEWRCETHLINRAMGFLIKKLCDHYRVEAGQIAEAYGMSELYLHTLREAPVVPIEVSCAPAEYAERARILCGDVEVDPKGPPFFLSYGDHTLKGEFKGPPAMIGQATRMVRPPYMPFDIELRSDE
jgi:hypothetical protein